MTLLNPAEDHQIAIPSTEHLTDYLNHKIYHSPPEIRSILPWEACSLIVKYATEMYHDGHGGPRCDDVNTLMDTIRHLEAKASPFSFGKCRSLPLDEYIRKELEMYDTFIISLIPQGQMYFTLPTSDITSLAMFFAFLFSILENPEPNHHYLKKNQLLFPIIIKELKFLFYITADVKLHSTGNPLGDKDLLKEFQTMANKAGNFIYSSIFASMPVNVNWFCDCLRVLMYNFYLLSKKIKVHCDHCAPFLNPGEISVSPFSSTDTLNSLFELESLLALLQDLLNRPLDLIDDTKTHPKKLYGELRSTQFFLKAVIASFPQQQGENDRLKICLISIRNVTAEAQFLIKTFLEDHFPVWYMILRLRYVITKFEMIGKSCKQVLDLLVPVYHDPDPTKPSQDKEKEIHTAKVHPSITHLSKYLTGQDSCGTMELTWSATEKTDISIPWEGQRLPWNSLSCLAVVCYTLKLRSDDNALMGEIRRLNKLASEYEADHFQKEKEISETFVNTVMPMVQKLFTLPKSSNNGHLAGFIHFLLQILNSEAGHTGKWYISLQKGLMFLFTILGDIPFQHTELNEVVNLIEEFSFVVNEAGTFIFSSTFTTLPVNITWLCLCLQVLVYRFHLLNEKIKEYCINSSKMLKVSVNPTTGATIDALFIVESLIADLETMMNRSLHLNNIVANQIKELQKKLNSAHFFLTFHDREIKEIKEGIMQIRDAAYEAEYLINSFVSEDIPVWYVTLRLPNVIQKLDILVQGVEEINKVDDLHVREPMDSTEKESMQEAVGTSISMHDSIFVGYKNEQLQILHELTGLSKNLHAILVYGMAGIGKTTLAKEVYNNGSITHHFDKRAWCVVSQTYQKRKVLNDILISLTSSGDKRTYLKMEDDSLGLAIYQTLFGRRYLVVIDDVWNSDVWIDLQRYFPSDGTGSRILFTSRVQDVVPTDSNSSIHTLTSMPEDQCWELLQKKVFNKEQCPNQLFQFGKQIAAKCSGVPLAVVIIAGILANMEREESLWEKVEKSVDKYMGECIKILELSYTHLPDHLKLCFLYLGVFPEDTEIPVQKLIRLWIAEGFIQKVKNKRPENVAQEYLNDLIHRSLVSIVENKSTGGVKSCRVHDLLRDMCLKKSQEEKFLTLVKDDEFSTNEKHQRLCIHSTNVPHLRPFSLHCRSFFGHLSDPSSSFPQIKNVRAMELPQSIEDVSFSYKLRRLDLLIHLRYLTIDRLPESILSNLVNLESLHIYSLSEEVLLPSTVLKMEKLRHLHVRDLLKIEKDCDISQDNHLETLSFLKIYQTNAYEILKRSNHLRKLKCMCMLIIPDFSFFTNLESLRVEVQSLFQVTRNSTGISLPLTIRKLTLSGSHLPWEMMSVLGKLPILQALKVLKDAFVGEEWEAKDGEFKELKFLKLQALQLKRWIAWEEHFPKLGHLVLNRCEKLQGIPADLGYVPTLQVIEVLGCSKEAIISANEIEQEQRKNGNDDLKVITTSGHSRGYYRSRSLKRNMTVPEQNGSIKTMRFST